MQGSGLQCSALMDCARQRTGPTQTQGRAADLVKEMMQTGQSGCLDLTDPLQRLLVRGLRWIYERMPGQNETEAGTMQEDDFMTQLKKMRAAFLKAQRQQKVRDKKKQVLESTGGTDADGTETLPARSGWVGTPCSECHTVCPAQYHCNA